MAEDVGYRNGFRSLQGKSISIKMLLHIIEIGLLLTEVAGEHEFDDTYCSPAAGSASGNGAHDQEDGATSTVS